ncbi:MAG TPA: DUF5818 domain-containing protein [Candidatus Sulfotelmatobacter sp.]|nr:DUF5818 domain-containing protein [Candidatus Sulfotelmatobacter sp.]
MRQVFLFLSVLLLGVSWAVAQGTSPSQSSPSTSSSDSSAQTSSQTSAGGETTVEGCLSGSSGSYTLAAKDGTTYQLTGDTAKLSEHVGHQVKITGTANSAASSPSSGAASSTAGSTSSEKSLQVSSVKHVSKTCQSGSGGMSH